ncbi:uncharacterized protein RCC_02355 [Ramularia collo-cygni]|uniref:4-coumarate--CoA ligase n=1 Tax=Ramularia collo-cygni TaxID=112498 RepID=A0A2D3UUC0_9PEZI|nr:uncharacterized protein RCC_02355 [Ramularia collo-cygni]CZT16520.1 uncharacterized protein RCC_02355 [Ramularia collo-cygni]
MLAQYLLGKFRALVRLLIQCVSPRQVKLETATYLRGSKTSELDDEDHNVVEWAFSGAYDGDKPILIDAENPARSLSKNKSLDLVTRLSGSFEPGSTVCLHLQNNILYPILVLAILATGCKWTGTNPACTRSELEDHLRVSRSKYIITSEDHEDMVFDVLCRMDEDIELILFSDVTVERPPSKDGKHPTLHDLLANSTFLPLESRYQRLSARTAATLMASSGTTGLPKMAIRAHGALVCESRSDELQDAHKPYKIRRLFCTPMFHAYSFPKMVINPLRQGQPTYYMQRFDDTFIQKLSLYSITDIITVPPILSRLVDQARGGDAKPLLQSLRTIICAGAPLTVKLRDEFIQLFSNPPQLIQEWGMTECGCISRAGDLDADMPTTVGRPVAGYLVKISQEERVEIPGGGFASELLVKGPQLMDCYLGDDSATASHVTSDGWYKTGDVGYLDARGRIFLVDRAKDIIKVNGWQVSAAELEKTVLQVPGVMDAAALSMGHSLDEHPYICVVRTDHGVSEKEIREVLRSQLSRYKGSRCELQFVDGLPRAASGKLLRRKLKAQLTHREK